MSASTHSPVLKHHFEDLGQQHACERLGMWMFLATEVLPLADRLVELGIDPTPLFAATSGILRLCADTLERPELRS